MRKYAYGFPRLGRNRQYKKTIEDYWNNIISEQELIKDIDRLQEQMLFIYERYVDSFPVGEMTFYDNMFDTALMTGVYRFQNMTEYYELCRGKNALEMTKWFNTNYHYLVPEIHNDFPFQLIWNKPKEYLKKHKKGIPYVIGPFTFLKLSKGYNPKFFEKILLNLGDVYRNLIRDFEYVHIDEPAFVMDLTSKDIGIIKDLYDIIGKAYNNIYLFTYYESVDFLEELYDLPVSGIGLDFVNGKNNLSTIQKVGFPDDKLLIAGVVNGHNVWRTDINETVKNLALLAKYADRLAISNAGPLFHLPMTIQDENLAPEITAKLAFAEERLYELQLVSSLYEGASQEARDWYQHSTFGENPTVKERVNELQEKDFVKPVLYPERIKMQSKILNLPLLPTTTIGSFPQTAEVRKVRANYRNGKITEQEYKRQIKKWIKDLIAKQEQIGLDVLVHGEFERTDMVEFFAEKLEGIVSTKNGWIISYGTRGYRPPIIFGDISRAEPMTIEEVAYAQSLTEKPVKGMLTGPVTIIAWSYTREDIPIQEVAYQISLCLLDEIRDYEKAGIKIVQIDEPAFREKAPIKRRNWDFYFEWAVKSFRLATNSKPQTQIHSHMCYSEFGEIIDKIAEMDFDVISIEATRSRGEVIESFEKKNFDRQIGLGVWDIHSPVVPEVEDIKKTIKRALKVIPKERFWVNPDCGLKTRGWQETWPALENLVLTAKELRKIYK